MTLIPRLIVSFHDVAPHTRAACDEFLKEAADLGVDTVSLLVVPRWHGVIPITSLPDFADWLAAREGRGHEICLHGFTHRAETPPSGIWPRLVAGICTDHEGEFQQVDRDTAIWKITSGLQIFRGIDVIPSGFTAPAWLMNPVTLKTLRDAGLLYATDLFGIHLLQERLYLRAPVIVFSTRTPWRRIVSACWARAFYTACRVAPTIRIAVHPGDMASPLVHRALLSILRHAVSRRESMTYDSAVRNTLAAIPPISPAYPFTEGYTE